MSQNPIYLQVLFHTQPVSSQHFHWKLCGRDITSVMESSTAAGHTQYCLWFHKSRSATIVQRKFKAKYNKQPKRRQTTTEQYNWFIETHCVVDRMLDQGRPSVSKVMIEQMHKTFVHSQYKSMRCSSLELNIPRPTVRKPLHKLLTFKQLMPYKLQLAQVKVTKKNKLNFV